MTIFLKYKLYCTSTSLVGVHHPLLVFLSLQELHQDYSKNKINSLFTIKFTHVDKQLLYGWQLAQKRSTLANLPSTTLPIY